MVRVRADLRPSMWVPPSMVFTLFTKPTRWSLKLSLHHCRATCTMLLSTCTHTWLLSTVLKPTLQELSARLAHHCRAACKIQVTLETAACHRRPSSSCWHAARAWELSWLAVWCRAVEWACCIWPSGTTGSSAEPQHRGSALLPVLPKGHFQHAHSMALQQPAHPDSLHAPPAPAGPGCHSAVRKMPRGS